jgi:hypothetical protein
MMRPTILGAALLGWAALCAGEEPATVRAVAGGATRDRAMSELLARVSDPDRLSHAVAVEAIIACRVRRLKTLEGLGARPERTS